MQTILDAVIASNGWPLLTAFLLGVLVAISPCTIAANVTAIALLTEKDSKRKIIVKGLYYTLGRTIAYSSLGIFLYFCAFGLNIGEWLQHSLGLIIGPLFILLGFLFLELFDIPGLDDVCLSNPWIRSLVKHKWSAILVGIFLAFAFCPYSGTIYFGALMPLVFSTHEGVFLPLAFSIGAALPIFPIIFIISKGMDKQNEISQKYHNIETWGRRCIGILFIIAGGMFIYEYYIE